MNNQNTFEKIGGYTWFSDLPSPEERILKRIHASQRKVEQPILGTLVPILPGVPGCTIGVRGGIRLDTLQVEAAIVETVAVLSSNSDTETNLTKKKAGQRPVK
jgi:hypothetical protein